MASEPAASTSKVVPPGFVVKSESTTSILFASTTEEGPAPVFLNPIQEYNRDLSIVAIRTWSEIRQKEKAAVWEAGVRKKWAKRKAKNAESGDGGGKRRKGEDGAAVKEEAAEAKDEDAGESKTEETKIDDAKPEEPVLTPPKFKFTLLEALSATGLRAIRYAKEIPLLRYVVANDLSASAVEDIRRNIEFNGLAPEGLPEPVEGAPPLSKVQKDHFINGMVRANEGDACVVMYNHRTEDTRFDCVDLDPYGSAVPFLDAAIGAVADGGLMCITCTDAGVLAGHNYPEKAFTHYGGTCVNAEFSHEVGLRLILNAIATTAGHYGRTIEPLVSLSIDFYMRVFVRVTTSPKEVKALASKTSLLYYCHDCQAPYLQPMGRVTEKKNEKTGLVNYTYHTASGPPPEVGEKCGECGGRFHLGGPMWSAPIHNREFVESMLEHVDENKAHFGTSGRIEGMLSIALQELDAPFYFTPARVASVFRATAPPLNIVASALVNGGYEVSRSHASAGSLKTNAPRAFVMDVFREWNKLNPVVMKNVKENSPASRVNAKAQTHEVDLKYNPIVEEVLMSKDKLVRYQVNPTVNWGPGRAAVRGKGKKATPVPAVPIPVEAAEAVAESEEKVEEGSAPVEKMEE